MSDQGFGRGLFLEGVTLLPSMDPEASTSAVDIGLSILLISLSQKETETAQELGVR